VQKWLGGFIFLPLLGVSVPASANFPEMKSYPQKVWDYELMAKYTTTTSNFTSAGGSFVSLLPGSSFNVIDTNLSVRTCVPQKNWAVWGDTQLTYAQSKSTYQTLSNTGFTHFRIGTDYIVYQDSFNLIPEFFFLYPITQNNFTSNTTGLSDGIMELSGKLYIQFKVNTFQIAGFAGYLWRDQGRSALVPYGVTGEMQFQSWSLSGNLQGYSSASSDNNTNNPIQQLTWMSTANAGSEMFDALNPQILELNLWLKVPTSKTLSFLAGGGTTLNGANMANYWDVQGGIIYRWPTSTPPRTRPRTNEEKFNEETSDGVDQNLFSQPANNVRTRPKPAPAAPKQNLQQQLDNTEMQIYMKTKKGKQPVDPDLE